MQRLPCLIVFDAVVCCAASTTYSLDHRDRFSLHCYQFSNVSIKKTNKKTVNAQNMYGKQSTKCSKMHKN